MEKDVWENGCLARQWRGVSWEPPAQGAGTLNGGRVPGGAEGRKMQAMSIFSPVGLLFYASK